jgi:hypothetical protein
LVCATAWPLACGSSDDDDSKPSPNAGAAGEMNEPGGAAGADGNPGSSGAAGTKATDAGAGGNPIAAGGNPSVGGGGSPGAAGTPVITAGANAGGDDSSAGGNAGASELAGGAGGVDAVGGMAGYGADIGAGGVSVDCTTDVTVREPPSPLPAFCPGLLADYTAFEGTISSDHYCPDLLTSGDDFVLGRFGPDVIEASDGDDCMLGGRQADRLEHGSLNDGIDVIHGGLDDDRFVFLTSTGYAHIVDFQNGADLLVLVKAGFGLSGVAGAALPAANRAEAAADLDESMNGGLCADQTPCIIYDASDGELFVDLDGSGAGLVDLVAVIDGFASYALDWDDFLLE